MILECTDHLQASSVADVREARIPMPTEVALQNSAVGRAVEERSPRLELAHAIRRFLRVELGHPPVVEVLAASHGVREVDAPVVAVVHVRERGSHAALGHHRVSLAEQRLADEAYSRAFGGGGYRGAKPRSAGADDQHIVIYSFEFGHSEGKEAISWCGDVDASPS